MLVLVLLSWRQFAGLTLLPVLLMLLICQAILGLVQMISRRCIAHCSHRPAAGWTCALAAGIGVLHLVCCLRAAVAQPTAITCY